jgi:Ca-activated chloride channel family protein
VTPARAVALAFLVGSWAAGSAAQETPTFSTGVEAIRLDVLVTNRDRVVLGLEAADFEVRDNGVLQDVELVSSEKLPLNVILALDTSGSVAGEPLEHLRSAAQTLLARLDPGDMVGLVTFSQEVALRERLTRDTERLGRALADVRPRGKTAVIDGSYVAMMLGETDIGRDLLIVFSDGVDTSSWLREDQVLEAARRSDVVIYGVSVRGTVEPHFLGRLTQITGGALFEVESTRDLSAVFVDIFDEFRNRYLLSYSPRGVSSEGWHRLEVKIKDRRGIARVRAGYMAGANHPVGPGQPREAADPVEPSGLR